MVYAPIGLSVYSRLQHLQKAVHSLENNTIARDCYLYIFSDAPKPGDEEKVAEIRQYLRTITGFKQITIIEREQNSRIENNRGGQKYLLNKYGKMIWLAEDILCAPGFLTFANQALDIYEDNKQIYSVSGYVEPFKAPLDYPYDAFFTHRFNAWGLAIWKDRYFNIPERITREDYSRLVNNNSLLQKFAYFIGEDAINMLRREALGEIDALDVRIMYYQFMNNLLTVRPAKSLTQNIGHDGSGIHCNKTNRFDVEPWDKTGNFEFPEQIALNRKYANRLSMFRRIKNYTQVQKQ